MPKRQWAEDSLRDRRPVWDPNYDGWGYSEYDVVFQLGTILLSVVVGAIIAGIVIGVIHG